MVWGWRPLLGSPRRRKGRRILLERFLVEVLQFDVFEDDFRLLDGGYGTFQVVVELFESRVEWHFVGCARQLGTPGRRVGHHPNVLCQMDTQIIRQITSHEVVQNAVMF